MLAISLDGGITYKISGFVNDDGIKPQNIANGSSQAMGGQGNIPTGNMVGGTDNKIRRWNLRIFPNLVVDAFGNIGIVDTTSREFKIGLFENVTVTNGIVDLSQPNGSPIEVFTIVQAGVDFDGEVGPNLEDLINDGDSII